MAENNKIPGVSIASIVGSGVKMGVGLYNLIKGRKEQKRLWQSRPKLGVTEGERENESLFNQWASATSMPGEQNYIDKMNEAVAGGVYDAQRTANSSLGATQAAVDLNGKKIQAIQDLAGQFAEFKAKRQSDLASWNNRQSELEMQRWDVNEFQPWNIKMNEAISRKQAGMQAFGQGVDSGMGTLNDLAGTKSMMDVYQMMYGSGANAGVGNQSKPLQLGSTTPSYFQAKNFPVNFGTPYEQRMEMLRSNGIYTEG